MVSTLCQGFRERAKSPLDDHARLCDTCKTQVYTLSADEEMECSQAYGTERPLSAWGFCARFLSGALLGKMRQKRVVLDGVIWWFGGVVF